MNIPSRTDLHDLLPRLGGIAGFGLLLINRTLFFSQYDSKMLWALELLYCGVMMCAYVVRQPLRGRAVGWAERYLPFLVAGLTFVIIWQPIRTPSLEPVAVACLSVGVGLECLGIWTLRRSFSIMVEARTIVTQGLYRYMRHPIYFGGILAAVGALSIRLHPIPLTLFLIFVVGELYRARLEEHKLCLFCPEYLAYRQQVPMFGIQCARLSCAASQQRSGRRATISQ